MLQFLLEKYDSKYRQKSSKSEEESAELNAQGSVLRAQSKKETVGSGQ